MRDAYLQLVDPQPLDPAHLSIPSLLAFRLKGTERKETVDVKLLTFVFFYSGSVCMQQPSLSQDVWFHYTVLQLGCSHRFNQACNRTIATNNKWKCVLWSICMSWKQNNVGAHCNISHDHPPTGLLQLGHSSLYLKKFACSCSAKSFSSGTAPVFR